MFYTIESEMRTASTTPLLRKLPTSELDESLQAAQLERLCKRKSCRGMLLGSAVPGRKRPRKQPTAHGMCTTVLLYPGRPDDRRRASSSRSFTVTGIGRVYMAESSQRWQRHRPGRTPRPPPCQDPNSGNDVTHLSTPCPDRSSTQAFVVRTGRAAAG
jgi:hypothetical protein